MSPTPAVQDRQDTWAPAWLCEVASAAAPKTFSTREIVAAGTFHHGLIIGEPTVTRSMTDTIFGFLEVSTVTVEYDNAGGAASHLYTTDLRGTTLTLKRFDAVSQNLSTEFTGIITHQERGVGTVKLTATAPNLAPFQEELPRGVVTAALFHSSAVDVGQTISVFFGNVSRHRCLYVRDVTPSYDYLVGRGSLTVPAVYRKINDVFQVVTVSEYTVNTSAYPGFTVIRFTVRQVSFQNSLYEIYADVTGPSAERNFIRAIRSTVSDTTWGLGQPVNAASFDAAETKLDPVTGTSMPGLNCDGVLAEPRQALDVLRELMMVRGIRLSTNSAGEWTVAIDEEQATTKMDIGDGTGAGERNILRVTQPRQRPAIDRQVKDVVLRYKIDPLQIDSRVEIRRTVAAFGADKIIEHRFIRDDITADKTNFYLYQRERLGAETVAVVVTQEGRALLEGDLVRITHPQLGYANETMEVRRVDKELVDIGLLLGSWSPLFYTYSAGTSPTDPGVPTIGAPSAPSSVTGTSLIEAVRLAWTLPTEQNFDVVEIWRSTTNDRATATKIGESRGVSFLDSNLTALTRYYYWTRSRGTPPGSQLSLFSQGDLAGLAVDTAGRIGYKLTLNANSRIATGTFSAGIGVAGVVFDANDGEADWLVRVGTDLHFGEATRNASLATAFGVKFASQNGPVWTAWDGTNVQVAIVVGGVVKWAKLDKDGAVLAGPVTLFSPSAGDSYAVAAISARGATLHWALLYDVGTPFASSKLRYARTDLSGSVTLAPTDVGGATLTSPAEDVRIGVDSADASHIFYKSEDIQAFQATAFQADAFQTDAPVVMQYVKVNTAGTVLIGPSSPLDAPPGTTDLSPAGVLVDNNDAIHVLGYTYTGEGVILSYGRLTTAAAVVVEMQAYYSTPTDSRFATAALDATLNQIYVAWAKTTELHQLRLDPVDPTGQTLENALPAVSL